MAVRYKRKKPTSASIDKAWASYQKRMRGLPKNKQNRNISTKAEFMKVNYPEHGQLSKNLSYRQIHKYGGG
ncbi:hypothetical protein LCGC14_0960200 [marine sediment metagenome]|uniref:Uncharacterized protein n=1 Tax=marine sediment metagenome TaxID=412755 RepID=A0A0F9NJF2_9ZZZZ